MVRRDFVELARADQDEDDNILSENKDEHGRVKYQEEQVGCIEITTPDSS